jgi:hypothetical protein
MIGSEMKYLLGIFLLLFVSSLWGIWIFFEKHPESRPHYHFFHKHPESPKHKHRHFYEYRRVIEPESLKKQDI